MQFEMIRQICARIASLKFEQNHPSSSVVMTVYVKTPEHKMPIFTANSVRNRSRDSSVGIATGPRGGREFESRWGQKFSLLHIVQTDSGVHPTSYKMGTGGSFPGVKRQGREAYHSPPTSAEVKKMWIYTSTLPYVFMA
jgi:hypothetical protein